jgi:hypothetical protein
MNAPASIKGEAYALDQLGKLQNLLTAAYDALQRPAVRREELWASPEGRKLVNAAYDLFEKDELYDFGQDLEREFGGAA